MNEYITQFPHCDPRVLHAPEDNCEWCNLHPEWQELRKSWGIAFTGHSYNEDGTLHVDEHGNTTLPCPAEANRGMRSLNSWHGNIAFTPEARRAQDEYFTNLRKELHEQFPGVDFDDDHHEIGGEG